MKAILHIGIEKTGTTALQSFLADNRQLMQDYGYAYLESLGLPNNRRLPTYCIEDDRHDDHHEVLNIVGLGERNVWKQQFVQAFADELKNLPEHIHTVVISSEHMHSRLLRASEVQTLKNLLDQFFDEIEVVVYLRRQDQLATSLYSTALKCGHSFETILPQVPPFDPYYNFELLLVKWVGIFGKKAVTPRLFDRSELINHDLVEDFLHTTGMTAVDLKKCQLPGRQNESLQPVAQAFLHQANKHIPMLIDGHFNPLREQLTFHLESHFSGKPGLPPRAQAIKFCAMFDDSNDRVAKEWFGREHLFEDNFQSYPEQSEQSSFGFTDAADVASTLLSAISQEEKHSTDKLLNELQSHPEQTTKLLADYFLATNPKLANYLRQNVEQAKKAKKAA